MTFEEYFKYLSRFFMSAYPEDWENQILSKAGNFEQMQNVVNSDRFVLFMLDQDLREKLVKMQNIKSIDSLTSNVF